MGFCGSSVQWSEFSWEAFSTLATGAMAVGAAIYVGRKQLAIQKKQTELQELQTNTQFLAFKADLFERRYAVYDRVEAFLANIVRNGFPPTGDFERDFLIAKGEANLLFSQGLADGLQEIWERASAHSALKSTMDHIFATEGHYGEGNPQLQADAFLWFADRLTSLSDLFAEMKLGTEPLAAPETEFQRK